MAAERSDKTPVDYVLLILSPALIMTLVGSLVFFLIEVLYAGEFKERLHWAFLCYVFGAVLVARISMTADIAARAPIYGIILAVLAWFALQAYVHLDKDNPAAPYSFLINGVLIGIVWWSTHRLTWDCCSVEQEGDDSGEGLLEAAGLEPKSVRVEDRKAQAEEGVKDPPGVFGWWARYRRYRDKRQKNRPLGVWVVYFSLAALPVFGLGQALLDVDDAKRRTNVFWFMAIYVASGLSLLLTTCFLSLRRYLRQRGVDMPVKMTTTWLATGAAIILVLLIVGALLPRPSAEYSLLDLNPARSEKREANRFSPLKDKAGKGEGQQGGSNTENKDGAAGKDSGNQDGKNSGKAQDKSESGGDKGSKDKGGDQASKDGKDGKSGKDDKGSKDSKDKSGDEKDSDDKSSDSKKDTPEPANNPVSSLSAALGSFATVLKWVVFAIVALIVLFMVFRHGLSFLANFTQWARDLLASLRRFWESLFGSAEKAAKGRNAPEEESELIQEAVPFAAFRNPFGDGTATQRPPQELLRYTFAALEAWARDRDGARLPHETALEFATRLAAETPALADDLRRFIGLYIRAEYARGALPGNLMDVVRQFWDRLEAVAEQPLST